MLILVPGFNKRVVQKVFQESGSFRPTSAHRKFRPWYRSGSFLSYGMGRPCDVGHFACESFYPFHLHICDVHCDFGYCGGTTLTSQNVN